MKKENSYNIFFSFLADIQSLEGFQAIEVHRSWSLLGINACSSRICMKGRYFVRGCGFKYAEGYGPWSELGVAFRKPVARPKPYPVPRNCFHHDITPTYVTGCS